MAGRIRSVLVASDLGPGSEHAVAAAAALAAGLGAELHLVNALDLERLPDLPAPSFPGRVRQAEEALAEQGRQAGGAGAASAVVLDYAPHKAIHSRAIDVAADLVVVGRHRGGDVGARFLGTTADRLIRILQVPVLVMGPELRVPLRRIGVPTDFSDTARRALRAAAAVAAQLAANGGGEPELSLFHVGWTAEREDGAALAKLEPALQREAAEAGAPATVRTELVWGVSPADAVRQYARENELDLLVMGTHGQGGLQRMLVGSVASGVARDAPCPVLMVPPEFPGWA